MTREEMAKAAIEEFSRLQDWMKLSEKDTVLYSSMKRRYIELKAILSTCNVNLTELDFLD